MPSLLQSTRLQAVQSRTKRLQSRPPQTALQQSKKSLARKLAHGTLLMGLCWSQFAVAAEAPPSPHQGQLPLNELRTFTEVLDRIKNAYVEPVDDKTLLENAIKGMLSELDPHSAFLEPDAFKDLQVSTSGEFGGLGIEVGMENGFVKVVTPIDDTPAQQAGVEAGDLIIKLDDNAVKGMSLGEAVKVMRGKPGSDIVLTIIREGELEPLKITVTRAVIQVKSVRGHPIDDGYGYVRISQFQVHTGQNFIKAMDKLEAETPLKGLILDLRNNPGGVLDAAVDISNAFLDDGLIVYTQGRIADSELKFNANEETRVKDIPVVVLVNGGSASASEIVAGALQDRKRAIIMGTNTFGKGSVQTILPLHNNRALKLTTARYYTPNGRTIQAQGIVPDIVVEASKVTKLKSRKGFKESDLQGHLENEEKSAEDQAKAKEEEKNKTNQERDADRFREFLEKDFQLREAINLLKGIHIHQTF